MMASLPTRRAVVARGKAVLWVVLYGAVTGSSHAKKCWAVQKIIKFRAKKLALGRYGPQGESRKLFTVHAYVGSAN